MGVSEGKAGLRAFQKVSRGLMSFPGSFRGIQRDLGRLEGLIEDLRRTPKGFRGVSRGLTGVLAL